MAGNPTTRPLWLGATLRPNARHIRAQRLHAHLMHVLNPILDLSDPDMDLHRRVSRAIEGVLVADGVEVLTDFDRQEAGLPPRGPDGWTIEEMLAMEKRRLEAMMAPLAPLIVKGPLS